MRKNLEPILLLVLPLLGALWLYYGAGSPVDAFFLLLGIIATWVSVLSWSISKLVNRVLEAKRG